jgi:signal transduction histidine kinase
MQRQFLERIRSASERTGSLLNDLLEATTTDASEMSLMPVPVEVMHCLEEAVSQVSSVMRDKQVTLHMDLPEAPPPVLGEEDALIQIFFHLLDNAVSATPAKRDVQISIQVAPTEEASFLSISVRDSGEGIPSDELARVLQRAYRADKIAIPGIGDTGFGLMTVKTLVEMLQGRIWVDSDAGEGSTFTILLPLAAEPSPKGD